MHSDYNPRGGGGEEVIYTYRVTPNTYTHTHKHTHRLSPRHTHTHTHTRTRTHGLTRAYARRPLVGMDGDLLAVENLRIQIVINQSIEILGLTLTLTRTLTIGLILAFTRGLRGLTRRLRLSLISG